MRQRLRQKSCGGCNETPCRQSRNIDRSVRSLERFSVDYDVETEVVSYDGQKLQFASSGEIKVQRPDKLHASRKGAIADLELILDGSALTLYGKNANAFFQLPATTIEQAVDALRNDVGLDAPGADLLSDKPLQHAETDTASGSPSTACGSGVIGSIAGFTSRFVI